MKALVKRIKNSGKRVLVWDLENLPNKGYFFQVYDANIPNQFISKTHAIISIAYKFVGDKDTQVISVADFPKDYAQDPYNDKKVVEKFAEIYNSADYVVAHYGDRHDTPMLHTRLMFNGLKPLRNVQTIDTCKLVKRHFKLNTNKLDHLGYWLKEGVKHPMGAQDWVDCAEGKIKAVEKMATYNKQDVKLLEKVFIKLLPYLQTKLNLNVGKEGKAHCCPHCGGEHTINRGYYNTIMSRKLTKQCRDCNHYFNVKVVA